MKVLLIGMCLSMLAMSGCTKGCSSGIGCSIEKTIVSGITPVIASQLQCSNPDAIKADLEAIINKTGVCSAPVKSELYGQMIIPGPICEIFGELVAGLAPKAIPSAWGCTAKDAAGLLKGVIVTACKLI